MALSGALQLLPKPIYNALRFVRRTVRVVELQVAAQAWARADTQRYLRHQGERAGRYTRRQSIAHITKTYHSLEKGLSLRDSRPGFGLTPALRLLSLIEEFMDDYGWDTSVGVALDALKDYLAFQHSVGHDLPLITRRVEEARRRADRLDAASPAAESGGIRPVTRHEISEAANIDFKRFLESRHSIRDFDTLPVSRSLLVEACRMAQLAPSACNRQAGRAHCFATPDKVREVLAIQPGNRGFGDKATAAIVVTAALDSYAGAGERHQALVDGSLFAMTLVYALHALGLGSCMLAWSVSPKVDAELRRVVGIPDNEEVIVLLAVGHLPTTLKVPASVRMEIDEFAKIHAPDDPARPLEAPKSAATRT